ncbi:MAG TPA: hypothetical protein VJS91_08760 [Nitrososphaeraceae archaeon]|nr:hypothetical protein [Nitrososphaeraceae archaeon]
MKNAVIPFLILVVLLFLGIAIMIKPFDFVLAPSQIDHSENTGMERIIPREIILLGSSLIVGAVVGLSIQGFWAFKEINRV